MSEIYLTADQKRCISELRKLKKRIATRNGLNARVAFVKHVFDGGVYDALLANDLLDAYNLGSRDLDLCFEYGDGNQVAIALAEEAVKDDSGKLRREIERDFGLTCWEHWMGLLDANTSQLDIF